LEVPAQVSDFNFLEPYRNASIPMPDVDGVVLTCDLGAGLSEHDIPAVAAGQLRGFWRFTTGGPLLVDRQFGICGLSLNDPTRSRQQVRDRASSGYEVAESDWVLGEFVGDTDMLIIDENGGVLVAAGSYPRRDWYRFDSLSVLLRRYVQSHAEKFWELTNR